MAVVVVEIETAVDSVAAGEIVVDFGRWAQRALGESRGPTRTESVLRLVAASLWATLAPS